MPYTITLNNDSPQALAFVEFAKNFDFLKVTKKREAKKALVKPEIDDLEEDEYGIPIKYRDEIMALSKKVNKAVAKRWEAAIAKRKDEIFREYNKYIYTIKSKNSASKCFNFQSIDTTMFNKTTLFKWEE